MSVREQPKPLFWVGSCKKDLKEFPVEVRRVMGFALFQAQLGAKHLQAKPLKGFGGARILEIVEDHDGATFRVIYTVKFAGAVYALHALQKKSKKGVKTPKAELELVRKRLKTAEEHYAKWRAAKKSEGKSRGE